MLTKLSYPKRKSRWSIIEVAASIRDMIIRGAPPSGSPLDTECCWQLSSGIQKGN